MKNSACDEKKTIGAMDIYKLEFKIKTNKPTRKLQMSKNVVSEWGSVQYKIDKDAQDCSRDRGSQIIVIHISNKKLSSLNNVKTYRSSTYRNNIYVGSSN